MVNTKIITALVFVAVIGLFVIILTDVSTLMSKFFTWNQASETVTSQERPELTEDYLTRGKEIEPLAITSQDFTEAQTFSNQLGVGYTTVGAPGDPHRPVPVRINFGQITVEDSADYFMSNQGDGTVYQFPTPLSTGQIMMVRNAYAPEEAADYSEAFTSPSDLVRYDPASGLEDTLIKDFPGNIIDPQVSSESTYVDFQTLSQTADEEMNNMYFDMADWEVVVLPLAGDTNAAQTIVGVTSPVWLDDEVLLVLGVRGLFLYQTKDDSLVNIKTFDYPVNSGASLAVSKDRSRVVVLDESQKILQVLSVATTTDQVVPYAATVTDIVTMPRRNNLWVSFTNDNNVVTFLSRAYGTSNSELWAYRMNEGDFIKVYEFSDNHLMTASKVYWIDSTESE